MRARLEPWQRFDEGPPLTPVFYVTDGDDVLVSITEDRAKTRALRRDPAISVCVLGEEMPFPYVTLFGNATIDADPADAFEVMARVVERMGRALDDDARKKLRERADREHRVVLRVTPQRSVSQPAAAVRPRVRSPSGASVCRA